VNTLLEVFRASLDRVVYRRKKGEKIYE